QSDSVPVKFRHCITTFEDEYFYYHPGFNPVSILKSLKRNFSASKVKSGGSTITMQVARMMRHNQSRNYWQKLVEILLAVRIELSYKKSSILNYYASNAPFGSNVVGLQAASWRYFGRSPETLSWAESALLAVLPNAPSLIYPGKNHDRLIAKRDRLLKKLYTKKIIDESTYKLALQEQLPEKPYPIPQIAPHLLTRVIHDKGPGKLYRSTINMNLQLQADQLLNKHIAAISSNQIYNACAIIAETETGNVLAYVGNSYSKTNEHQNYVDIIQAPRSTGSILKPFLYGFMLNDGKILPGSLIEDVPIQIGAYGPKNFDLNYDGLVPANKAIARSLNVPAVKMLMDYGNAKFHYRLKQLGFTTFTKPTTHYGLSLILGGGEASLWEVAGAYSSMGRSLLNYSNTKNKYAPGSFHALHYLNQEEAEKKKYTEENELISASSVWFTLNAMTELIRPSDYVGWAQFSNKTRIAWKTGTSFGFRDAWAVGLNDKYTVAVWVGNASGEGRPDLTGTRMAAPLMFDLFNFLQKRTWFQKPVSDMQKVKLCRQSGYRASEVCPDTEEAFCQKGSDRVPLCKYHKIIHLDETGAFRVNSNCYSVDKMKHVPIDETGSRGKCIFKAAHKKQEATLFWYLDGTYIGSTQKFHQLSAVPEKGKHTLTVTDNFGETAACNFEAIDK
ncbi:MAG: pbpC, partial [Bacteroidetes bacterium]|nr:pbpC [Bacteroidota bacterium]